MLLSSSLLSLSPYIHRPTPEAAARRAMTDIRATLLAAQPDNDAVVRAVAKGATLLPPMLLCAYQAELSVRMLVLAERDRAYLRAALRDAAFDAQTMVAQKICKGLAKLLERSLRAAA